MNGGTIRRALLASNELSEPSAGGTARTTGPGPVPRAHLLVLVAATAVSGLLAVLLAANTLGQTDVAIWQQFAAVVRAKGPIGIYGVYKPGLPVTQFAYNHPPLVGWMLELVSRVANAGLGFPLAVRLPAIIADAICVFVVHAVLRRRIGERRATIAAVALAFNPVLFIISGYHGNNDPIAVMLAILSAYLLVDRRMPFWSGVAVGLSISVKLPPVVVIPALALAALYFGGGAMLRWCGGGALVGLVLWVPVLLKYPNQFRENVLGYTGDSFPRTWGLMQFGHWLHLPNKLMDFVPGPGRFLILLLCAGAGVLVVLRDRTEAAAAAGLAMVLMLLLTPGWAPQYMTWAAAPLFLLDTTAGVVYMLAAGGLLFKLYTRWSGGLPWNRAFTNPFTPHETVWAAVIWGVLLLATVRAVWALLRRTRRSATPEVAAGKPTATVG